MQETKTINALQDEVIEEFELTGDDWMDRYQMLIDMGGEMEPLPDSDKTEQNLIDGCQSRVWVVARMEDGRMRLKGESDALIVKGIVSLLLRVMDNHTPQEIVDADLYFIDRIGLSDHLSPTRSNGLVAMVRQIRAYAKAFAAASQAAPELPAAYHRRQTTLTHVGGLTIGSEAPIRIQSMATTNTNDTEASVAQAKRIIDAGGELVRFTTQGSREAENMRNISERLKADGYTQPLVADVHFNAHVADVAAQYCEKVRINPGNYVDPGRVFKHLEYTDEEYAQELKKIEERLLPFIDICRQHHTAVRIGVNHGSLSDRIMSRYGDTPEGIVESCMEFLRIFRREHFDDVVISIKASNTVVMVQSVRLLVKAMDREDMHYPLHLGVTEAGEGEDGRIKSAVGIGALLTEGIGDTIRVSLSEEPEAEIPVARFLVDHIEECARLRAEAEASIKDDTITLNIDETDPEALQLKASMAVGALLIDRKATKLNILTSDPSPLTSLADAILQAARIKFTKTEYISCPGCGRTLYNLQDTIRRIKAATAHLKGLKIGIMGCIVNGPGEMADADYGYVGAGVGRISLYRGKECVEKNIPEADAVEHLLALIERDGLGVKGKLKGS